VYSSVAELQNSIVCERPWVWSIAPRGEGKKKKVKD
jgi:hypothetical protein